ncbi:MAG: ACT domain-containing protein [Eubacteriales bacterium]|nr:ACT domain-containing protein [Eubacteriales bacterium]
MISQISIFAENKKGAISAITRILAEEHINILSFVTNDSAEFGIVRMLVSDDVTAEKLLREAGYQIKRTTVMAVVIPDAPGSLHRLLECIELANVNIDYLYTSFDRGNAAPVMIIHAEDMDELETFLKYKGFPCSV